MEKEIENQKIEEKSKLQYKKAVLLITFPCAILAYILCSFVAWNINFTEWHWVLRLIFMASVVFCFCFFTIMRWKVEAEKKNLKASQTKSDFQQILDELLKQQEKAEQKESDNKS